METKESHLLIIQKAWIHVIHLLTQNTVLKDCAYWTKTKSHRKQTDHLHEDVQPHINTILKERIFSLALQDTSRETGAIQSPLKCVQES